jgi:hypothetical protein
LYFFDVLLCFGEWLLDRIF